MKKEWHEIITESEGLTSQEKRKTRFGQVPSSRISEKQKRNLHETRQQAQGVDQCQDHGPILESLVYHSAAAAAAAVAAYPFGMR